MYGANALFGVINVITKSGSDLAGAEAAVAAGSFGRRRRVHHTAGMAR